MIKRTSIEKNTDFKTEKTKIFRVNPKKENAIITVEANVQMPARLPLIFAATIKMTMIKTGKKAKNQVKTDNGSMR